MKNSLFLIFTLLWMSNLAQIGIPSGSPKTLMQPIFKSTLDKEETKEVSMPGITQGYLLLVSKGRVEVTIENPITKQKLATFECSGLHKLLCVLPQSPNGLAYIVVLKNLDFGASDEIILYEKEQYDVSYQRGTHIKFSKPKQTINLTVHMDSLGRKIDPKTERLKFVAKKTVGKSVMNNTTFLEMIISNGLLGARTNYQKSLLVNDSSLVSVMNGLQLCVMDSCSYNVQLVASGVGEIFFSVSIEKYIKGEVTGKTFSTTDEVFENMPLAYKITAFEESNWEFVLVPLKGNPDLYITNVAPTPPGLGVQIPPGQTGIDFHTDKAIWKSENLQEQDRIIITKKDCEDKKIKCDGLYVIVASKERAYFKLMTTVSKGKPQFILDMNVPYTGTVANGEIINFLVHLKPDAPETLRASVELLSSHGNPDLYLIDCFAEDPSKCLIDESYITNRESLANDSKSYFRYSAQEEDTDKIYLEINIKPKGMAAEFHNSHYVSKHNYLIVAVKGETSGISSGSDFLLHFDADTPHTKLAHGLKKKVEFLAGEKKYFMFSNLVDRTGTPALDFIFNLFSGEINVYISKTHPYPAKDGSHTNTLYLKNNQRNFEFTADSITIKNESPLTFLGQFYIGIEALQPSFVEFYGFYEDAPVQKGFAYPLKPGQTKKRQIKSYADFIKDKYDEYKLSLVNIQSQRKEYVIRLKNFSGKMELCIQGKNSDFSSSDDCFTDSHEDFIIFSHSDEETNQFSELHIMARPIFAEQQNTSLPDFEKQDSAIQKAGSSIPYRPFFDYEIEIEVIDNVYDLNGGQSYTNVATENSVKNLKYTFHFTNEIKFAAVTFNVQENFDVHNKGKIRVQATIDKTNVLMKKEDSVMGVINNFGTLTFNTIDLAKYCGGVILPGPGNNNRRLEGNEGDNRENNEESDDEEKQKAIEKALEEFQKKEFSFTCTMHIKVSGVTSDENFSLTTFSNKVPILLQDGDYTNLPNPYDEDVILKYTPFDNDKDISFNFYTNYVKISAKILVYDSQELLKDEPEPSSELVKVCNGSEQISVFGQTLSKVENPVLYIILKNISRTQESQRNSYQPFYKYGQCGIVATSDSLRLIPGTNFHLNRVKGSMTYFKLTIPVDKNVLVALNVDGSGDADLFIAQGANNYPTRKVFYKKSADYSDDEITLMKADHQKMLKGPLENAAEVTYTVGVYAYQTSSFDLIAITEGAKIIKGKPGQRFNLYTDNENPLIFEIPASRYYKSISFIYWAENYHVDYYQTIYDRNDDFKKDSKETKNPLLENIPCPKNYVKHGSTSFINQPERVDLIPDAKCMSCSFLVAFYPRYAGKVKVNMIVYHKNSDLLLQNNSPVKQILRKGESQGYKFVSDYKINSLKLNIALNNGKLQYDRDIPFGTNNEGKKTVSETLSFTGTGNSFDKTIKALNNFQGVQNEFSFTLKALEDVNFTVVAAVDNKFKFIRLSPGEDKYIKIPKKEVRDIMYYNSQSTNYRNVTLRINSRSAYDFTQDIEVYEYASLNEDGQKMLKMNSTVSTNSYPENSTMITYHLDPTRHGYTIFRVKNINQKEPMNLGLRLVINDQMTLLPNTRELFYIPPNGATYLEMPVSESGYWKISASSCTGKITAYYNTKEPIFTDNSILGEIGHDGGRFEMDKALDSTKIDVVYIKLQNNDHENGSEISLTSVMHQYNRYSSLEWEGQISVKTPKFEGMLFKNNSLYFKVKAPVISDEISQIYQNATSALIVYFLDVSITDFDISSLNSCTLYELPAENTANKIEEYSTFFYYNRTSNKRRLQFVGDSGNRTIIAEIKLPKLEMDKLNSNLTPQNIFRRFKNSVTLSYKTQITLYDENMGSISGVYLTNQRKKKLHYFTKVYNQNKHKNYGVDDLGDLVPYFLVILFIIVITVYLCCYRKKGSNGEKRSDYYDTNDISRDEEESFESTNTGIELTQ